MENKDSEEDTGFTICVESESMPDMRSNRSGKNKKKPKLVQASFQAGESQVAPNSSNKNTISEETEIIIGNSANSAQ